jgi:hypothetical protein
LVESARRLGRRQAALDSLHGCAKVLRGLPTVTPGWLRAHLLMRLRCLGAVSEIEHPFLEVPSNPQ